MTKLRMLHCFAAICSNGVEQLKLIKSRQLDKGRYEQALICTQAIEVLPAQFMQAGCTIHEIDAFPSILDKERYVSMLDSMRKLNPDIIYAAVYEGIAVATLVGRWAGVPVIIGEETSDPVNWRWRGSQLFQGLASLTHHMVAVSPAVQDYLVNRVNLSASKLSLINNGVAVPAPTSEVQFRAVRDAVGLQPVDFIINSCGRLLDEHKRFSDLIQAFSRVREQFSKARLLIVGEGPDEVILRNLAHQLGVAEHVIFSGYQGDTWPFYEVMDIFALSSAHEAFVLVLVEAMFACLPVVATRVDGIPSVIKDDGTGYLVAPKTLTKLADRFLVSSNDALLCQSMRQAESVRGRAEFGADSYVRQFDESYQRLAAKRIRR